MRQTKCQAREKKSYVHHTGFSCSRLLFIYRKSVPVDQMIEIYHQG